MARVVQSSERKSVCYWFLLFVWRSPADKHTGNQSDQDNSGSCFHSKCPEPPVCSEPVLQLQINSHAFKIIFWNALQWKTTIIPGLSRFTDHIATTTSSWEIQCHLISSAMSSLLCLVFLLEYIYYPVLTELTFSVMNDLRHPAKRMKQCATQAGIGVWYEADG